MVTLKRRVAAHSTADDAVGLVLALAVLLETGATPATAWRCLAEDAGDESVAARVAAGLPDGIPAAIEAASDSDWSLRALAATWRVAEQVGAPMAPALRAIASALHESADCQGDVRIALAEPASAARLMALLPLVGLLMGAGLGFGTLSVLLTHPIGIVCCGLGLGLMVVARRWTARLATRAQPAAEVPGLRAELLAIALSSGASIGRAEALVDDALGMTADASADSVLELSRRAGVPAVELLRASAVEARRRYRIVARSAAAELSSKLLVPLGVCTLPAFLLLGVAPMVLSVLGVAL